MGLGVGSDRAWSVSSPQKDGRVVIMVGWMEWAGGLGAGRFIKEGSWIN